MHFLLAKTKEQKECDAKMEQLEQSLKEMRSEHQHLELKLNLIKLQLLSFQDFSKSKFNVC